MAQAVTTLAAPTSLRAREGGGTVFYFRSTPQWIGLHIRVLAFLRACRVSRIGEVGSWQGPMKKHRHTLLSSEREGDLVSLQRRAVAIPC